MNRLLATGAAVLGVGAAAVAVAVWQRQPASEWLAIRAAGWAGLPVSRLHVAEIDAGRAVLTDIRIGPAENPDLSVDRLVLTYDADSLRHERAKDVAVAGLRIAARWRDGRLSLGALDGLLAGAGNGGGAGFRLPFDSLSLTAGEIAVETPWGSTRLPLHGDLRPAGDATAGPRGRLTAGIDLSLKAGGGALTAKGEVVAGIDAESRAATLAIDAVFDVSGDALSIEDARLRGDTRIAVAGGTVSVWSDGCLALSLRQATAGTNRLSWPIELCPAAAAKPILVVETAAAGGPLVTLAGHVASSRLDGTLGGIDVAGLSPDATLGGSWKSGAWTAGIGLRGGDLTVLDGRVGLDGLMATVEVKGSGSAAEARLDLASATLRDKAASPRVAPLLLSGEADLAGTAARFAAKAVDAEGILEVTAEGRHDLASASGEVAFRSAPLTFAPDRQPQRLLPPLRGQVTSVAGTLTMAGSAAWKGAALTSGLTLSYTDGALSTPVAELAGIEAKVSFDSLWPVSTPPGQTVTIAAADVGIPLTAIAARFQVLPEGAVLVEQAGWPWAGGTIETRDVRFTPGAERHNLILEVRDVDLASVVTMVDLDGLVGSGRLNGRIPVEVVGDTPYIRGGHLSTGQGGGVIGYASESTDATLRNSGAGGELLADALKDFHYTEVTMDIDGETTGPIDVRLRVAGANPNLYDGHPIELNVNVEGDLGQLLRAGTVGSTDNIRRQIEERRLGEPK